MKLRHIMTRRPEVVRPDTPLTEAAGIMRDLDIGIIPVCEGDSLKGMLSDRDITIRATARGLDPATTQVEEIMTPEVVTCFEDQDVREAACVMMAKQLHRVVVLNRERRLTGIVSLGDLAGKSHEHELAGRLLDDISQPGAVHAL